MSHQNPEIDVHALMRGLVHELRNPLSAVLTASTLLQGGDDVDEETVMLLDVVQKESRRMNRILTEFSSFVKPPQARPEAFDLAHLLRSLAAELQREDVLTQRIALHDELPAILAVHADATQTRQALHHVLSNAAEAMEHGGALHLSAQVEGSRVWVCVDDSGEGLSEGALQHAFQPFFSTKPASTGLGLSIARSLLRASHGDLILQNRHSQEHGVRVEVHLPGAQRLPDAMA